MSRKGDAMKRKMIGQIGVDSGMIEIGDGGVQLRVPTKMGDGIFPVYLSADGCKITIDTTPFKDIDLSAWLRQMARERKSRKSQ